MVKFRKLKSLKFFVMILLVSFVSMQTLWPEIIVKADCTVTPTQTCSNLSQQDFDAIVNNWPNWVPCSGETSGSSSASTSTGISSGSVYILGDSITDRAASTYQTAFQQKGITAVIDASDSRGLNAAGINGNKLTGMQAIATDAGEIQQAGAIVIALGTNGGNTNGSIDQAIAAIRADNNTAPIYWVDTMVVNRPDYDSVIQQANQAIYTESTGDDYTVIPWSQTVDPGINPEAISGNMADPNGYIDPNPASGLGVHPSIPTGVNALVNLVVGKVAAGGTSSSGSTSGTCCGSSNSAATAATATAVLTGNNVQDAYTYFVSNGFTAAQSAGIVGNLMVESGVNPTEEEIGGGGGYGIAQFTGAQLTEMRSWTAANGLDPTSLNGQLQYLLYDITTGDNSNVAPAVKATSDPASAADAFEKTYERAGVPALQQRENDAEQVFNQFGSGASSGGSSSSSTASTGCSSSGSNSGTANCSNGGTAATGDAKILCEAQLFAGAYYSWGGGPHGQGAYTAFATKCPADQVVQLSKGSTGVGPCSADCSGLVSAALDMAFGQNLGWTVSDQGYMEGADAGEWSKIDIAQAQPGDIVTLDDSTGHVEVVSSVQGDTVNTFGTRKTGTPASAASHPVSYWTFAFHWTGAGSGGS